MFCSFFVSIHSLKAPARKPYQKERSFFSATPVSKTIGKGLNQIPGRFLKISQIVQSAVQVIGDFPRLSHHFLVFLGLKLF